MLPARRHHLNDIPRLQAVLQWDEAIVHLRTNTAMPNIGVDEIGKVEWRGASGELLDVSLRREDIDLVLEDVEAHPLKELGGVGDVALPLKELTEPGELRVVRGI